MTFLVSTGEADESDEDVVDLAVMEVTLEYREYGSRGLFLAFSFSLANSSPIVKIQCVLISYSQDFKPSAKNSGSSSFLVHLE